VLDRIVGYDVSALVWSKLAFGLSAGRVQSVALRLIVDREQEVEAFVPEEYWNVSVGVAAPSGAPFVAKLAAADGEKLEVKNGETAALVYTAGTSVSAGKSAYDLNPFHTAETLSVHLWYTHSESLVPDASAIGNGSALVLLAMVLIFNVAARIVGRMLSKRLTAA